MILACDVRDLTTVVVILSSPTPFCKSTIFRCSPFFDNSLVLSHSQKQGHEFTFKINDSVWSKVATSLESELCPDVTSAADLFGSARSGN